LKLDTYEGASYEKTRQEYAIGEDPEQKRSSLHSSGFDVATVKHEKLSINITDNQGGIKQEFSSDSSKNQLAKDAIDVAISKPAED
jgi:hypothetical protein